MGAVYLGENTALGKKVAIKVLAAHISSRAELVERFQREARSAASLDHPNLVRVYDVGRDDDLSWFIMEYVEGESLRDRLERETRLEAGEALAICREIARGLAFAHSRDLIHRDIKPDNIMLASHGQVLIADFGLAKNVGDATDVALTATGAILGTPYYMSPEQCEGLTDIDGRSDIYSLGLLLYTLLTGKVPAEGQTPLKIIHNRISKDPKPPIELVPDLDPEINALTLDLMRRDRDERPGRAEEVVQRLDLLLAQRDGRPSGRLISVAAPTPLPEEDSKLTVLSAPSDELLKNSRSGSSSALRSSLDSDTDVDPEAETVTAKSNTARRTPATPTPPQETPQATPAPDRTRGGGALKLVAAVVILGAIAGGAVFALRPTPPIGEVAVEGLPAWSSETRLKVRGKTARPGITVTLEWASGSVSFPVAPDGSFERELELTKASNAVVLRFQDRDAKPVVIRKTVQLDRGAPRIEVDGQVGDVLPVGDSGPDALRVSGRIVDASPCRLSLNGQELELNQGRFERRFDRRQERLHFVAVDSAGLTSELELSVQEFFELEQLSEVRPISSRRRLSLEGKLSRACEVEAGGVRARTDSDGRFELAVPLKEGVNELRLVATCEGLPPIRKSLKVICDTTRPRLLLEGEVGGPKRAEDGVIRGLVQDDNAVRVSFEAKDGERELNVSEAGAFEFKESLGAGRLVATDAGGNQAIRNIDEAFLAKRRARPKPASKKATPLTLTLSPFANPWSSRRTVRVVGRASRGPVSVRVGELVTQSDASGRFAVDVPLEKEGENRLRVTVRSGESQAKEELSVFLDTRAPRVVTPSGGHRVREGLLEVVIEDRKLAGVELDGLALALPKDGAPLRIKLDESRQKAGRIKLALRDAAGNRSVEEVVFAAGLSGTGTAETPKSPDRPATEASKEPESILEDLEAWRGASETEQDKVIGEVGHRLGPYYETLGARVFRCNGVSVRIGRFRHKPTRMELHLIPGGSFQMGEEKGNANEKPVAKVTLEPFLIGAREVSQREWDAVRGPSNRSFPKMPMLPMEGISWEDCQTWLKSAGGGLRLPSEAEWEYACRGGTTTLFYYGTVFDTQYSWHKGNAKSVGADKRPGFVHIHEGKRNAFGLVDMLGNVREWCEDDYLPTLDPPPVGNAPRRTKAGNTKVARGGSFMEYGGNLHCAGRKEIAPATRAPDRGFRVALSIP